MTQRIPLVIVHFAMINSNPHIDKGLRLLIKQLNKDGYLTCSCCTGMLGKYGKEHGWAGQSAFITFKNTLSEDIYKIATQSGLEVKRLGGEVWIGAKQLIDETLLDSYGNFPKGYRSWPTFIAQIKENKKFVTKVKKVFKLK